MTEPVIDGTVFDSLKESVGADFVPELVNAFLEEAPGLIAQLCPALLAGDTETFRRAAHSIKSNAATFGATRLFEQSKELEFMARENRLAEVGGKVEALEKTFARTAEALRELCP
jgi:HPt (histidine-containing phosphotransfer) domain-containing protein